MDKSQRAKEMRELPQDLREKLIADSDNVIGYERFGQVSRQVELSRSYKKPK